MPAFIEPFRGCDGARRKLLWQAMAEGEELKSNALRFPRGPRWSLTGFTASRAPPA